VKADAFAKHVMKTTLETGGSYLDKYAAAMGAFVVRFSGEKLAHVGKAVDAALDRVLALAQQPVSFRGFLTKGAKRTRYDKAKPIQGAGRKTLTDALATMKALPMEASMIYFFDGQAESLVPKHFAAYVSLAKDAGNTFATGKGFLSVAVSMESLADAKLLAVVDEIVVLLGAEVAHMGPAVWLAPHCLFNSSSNDIEQREAFVALWGASPQLEIPSFLAARSPFAFDEYEPSALAGLLAPSWRMWLGAALAKKVKKYGGTTAKLHGGATRYHATDASPFEMSTAIYDEYKARWAELSPVHVTNESDGAAAWYYRARFAAKTFTTLHDEWKTALDVATKNERRSYEITGELAKLAQKPTTKLITYAESIAKEMTASHAWYFLPGLRDLLEAGKAKPEEATVWLDLCEQMNDNDILPKAAAVAAAAGEHDRAIDLLRRAIKAGRANPKHIAKDPDYKPIRKHPQYAKLVGR
jgi:hypothetical protein